tara:strand:+ start:823 stop:1050 length:228 start_codon:yes stop_codon:yes gene_type:complete
MRQVVRGNVIEQKGMIGSREPCEADFETNTHLHTLVKDIRGSFPRPKGKGLSAKFVSIAGEEDFGPPFRCLYKTT